MRFSRELEVLFVAGLDELRELSLSQNLLTSLPATLLRRTPRLERLDLYANRLRGLPAGLLAGLPRLLQVLRPPPSGGHSPGGVRTS